MTYKSLASILLFCILFLTGEAQPPDQKTRANSIFSIARKTIPLEEFIYLYRKNHPENKTEEYTAEKVQEYLDLFIKFKLKVEEARYRRMDTTAAFRKEFNTYREELRKPYLPDNKLIDSLVAMTYERLREEVNVFHILINLKPDADPQDTLTAYQKILGLRTRIINGEDFSTVAMANSEDPSVRINKGNLGYFTAFQMVFPFEQAAYTTDVGKISMPVRTNFGYHLLYVADRRPSRGEVEVSHIMLRTGEGYDNEKARNLIFDIYDQLQKGVKWEELCQEYSQDPSSKDNGGRLRAFGTGSMPGLPEFEQMAFDLKNPGDISDPFQTRFGWHILRLENKIPLPSFETLASSLKSRVTRDERVQLSRQAIQTKMRKEFGFSENSLTKNKIMGLADSSLTKGKWKPSRQAVNPAEVLFTIAGKPHAAEEFLNYAIQNQKSTVLAPDKYLVQLYDQFVEGILGLLLEEQIKQQHPDYAWLLNEYYEGILLFEIMEKEVWNKASEDSVGQQNYYQSHVNNYLAKERAKGVIYSTPSNTISADLKALVDAGDSLKIAEFVTSSKIKQEKGSFEKADRPILSTIDWSPGVYRIENNGVHYVIWVRKILPAGPRTFTEARPAVISDYQNFLEEQWISRLREKFKVKINKKGKQLMEQQLIKK
jgi:peptidyl-prolyl cis-trans isomerase SurA